MITLHLIETDGTRHAVAGHAGQTLMRVATAAGVDAIAADCGGTLSCATCHVLVDADWAPRLPPPNADERAMLEMTAVPARPESRLSCQIELNDGLNGLTVHLPATQY